MTWTITPTGAATATIAYSATCSGVAVTGTGSGTLNGATLNCAPLGVSLIDFTAEYLSAENANVLSWHTAGERFNDHCPQVARVAMLGQSARGRAGGREPVHGASSNVGAR